MWSILVSAALGLLRLVLGIKKADPAVQMAADAATAQSELHQEEAANVIRHEASAARAAADARGLRDSGPLNAINPSPDAPVNQSPDAHFRD